MSTGMLSAVRAANRPQPTGYYTRITPRGIERPRKPARQLTKELAQDFLRILTITKAEMKATYFGKSLGWVWLLLEPLLMAGVYWFLTAVLFQLRDAQATNRFLSILIAIVFWVWFMRSVANAPLMFTSYGSLLRDTDFPIVLLLGVTLAKDMVIMCLNFLVALFFLVCFQVHFGIALIALPVVMLAEFMVLLPCVMILSMMGVFIKDLSGVLGQLLPLVWYLSPGLYPVSFAQQSVPGLVPFLMWNPFFYIFPSYDAVFLNNTWPDFWGLGCVMVVSLPFIVLAFALFHRARYYYYNFL